MSESSLARLRPASFNSSGIEALFLGVSPVWVEICHPPQKRTVREAVAGVITAVLSNKSTSQRLLSLTS